MHHLPLLAALFLESVARPLLIVHVIAAAVFCGVMTHECLCLVAHLRGRLVLYALEKTYSAVAFWACLVTWISGALVYVTFRVRVRAEIWDKSPETKVLSALFEVKESGATILLAIVTVLYFLSRRIDLQDARGSGKVYVVLGLYGFALVWALVLPGLYLVIREGV